ncbi:hypothetical protein BDZ89DRAFT_390012 [Hymenopellis radicata]|nr:hypothetical protein BDZ89DRAFT_390012 [Hymenopellis radicata]
MRKSREYASHCALRDLGAYLLVFSRFFNKWNLSERNAFTPSRTLWTISQVCQAWRNIAFSIPSLWSCIDLTFPTDGQKEVDVYMLERILLLSRQYPLHIILQNELQVDCLLRSVLSESHASKSLCRIPSLALRRADRRLGGLGCSFSCLDSARSPSPPRNIAPPSMAGSSGWHG